MTFLYLLGLWVFQATQKRPIFIAAGILALAGLVLILFGFVAELVVNQGQRLAELEEQMREDGRL